MKLMILAIGGNSLIRAGEKGTVAEQVANARAPAVEIVGLLRAGYRMVITHGNGPQVGAALLRSERAAAQVAGQSLDVCDASTQGEIGYILQQALNNELAAAGLKVPVISVLTQCVVSANDPAMLHASKPIGPFYSRSDAEERRRRYGWEIVEDAARGYRRIVPSPEPVEIVELDTIRELVRKNVVVIACGGGGIPVVRRNGVLTGVEAVIDKDRASALLAMSLGADRFVISTDTDFVYLNYREPSQRALTCVTERELEYYADSGQFPEGSMGPKIESVIRFMKSGGEEAIITSTKGLCDAVAGIAGTHIVRSEEKPVPRFEAELQVKGN
ncbi:MAG: carbamate kinase [Acidobacteriales bacterium]|nr:carbamate kinase [Terriglobales bacterium]